MKEQIKKNPEEPRLYTAAHLIQDECQVLIDSVGIDMLIELETIAQRLLEIEDCEL